MFKNFVHKIKLLFTDDVLRKRMLFVLGALVVFRFLANIPVPGVDVLRLEQYFSNNQFLELMNLFSGGGLANLSIVLLGVGPFITASIIMQLMTVLSPKIKALYHEEGEAGRVKFIQYSRYLTVPLAVLQGIAFLLLLSREGVLVHADTLSFITNVAIVVAGSILLMWIGELVTEFGIGNGVSLIIFAGIVASIPSVVVQSVLAFDITQLPIYAGLVALVLLVTAAVVFITEAERPIPITYSKEGRGIASAKHVSTYIPIRVNQSGMIPIIFAISLILFPQMVANFLVASGVEKAQSVALAIQAFMTNSFAYSLVYAALVFIFTFFYTAITFEPKKMADNLQKSGAFIPGVRPGEPTVEFLGNVVTRITFVGAVFLAIIAVLPILVQASAGVTTFAVGGASILIVVAVVLDIIKKIEAQLSIREY